MGRSVAQQTGGDRLEAKKTMLPIPPPILSGEEEDRYPVTGTISRIGARERRFTALDAAMVRLSA